MKLYVFPIPTNNASKAMFTAELLGVDYDIEMLDPRKGEHKSEAFLAINPMGRIPVLEHDGKYLSESSTIARYLCCLNGNQLYGQEAWQRAQVDQWVDQLSNDVGPATAVYAYQELIRPRMMGEDPDQQAVAEAGKKLERLLPVVEAQLQSNEFIAGPELSIADAVGHAFVAATRGTSFSLAAYPKLAAWSEKLSAMPEWQAVLARFPEMPAA